MNAPLMVRSAGGQLSLDWADGRTQHISHPKLRAACPCSQCRAARQQGRIDVAPAGVRLLAIIPQGYGVQLVFDDGHERGIYPWHYLSGLTA